jgi:small subunit ribosomal protein S5
VAEEEKKEELKEEPTKEGTEEELQGESALEDAEKEKEAEKKEKAEEKEDEKKELKEEAKEEEKEAEVEEEEEEKEIELKDQVISIRRVTKVVKGGKNLSFSALAAVGNENGLVGIGKGKAREVPMAIAKAVEDAKKKVVKVPLADTTVPHFIKGEAGGGAVILRPASKGTGVIAGGAVRTIMELAGIKDILTKSIRSNNPVSVAHATMNALQRLKDPETVSKYRGKTKDRIWQ